jgi:hypothetical protein
MATYRKRPIEIEAVQYNGGEPSKTLRTFLGSDLLSESTTFLLIRTLDGTHRVDKGDFIMQEGGHFFVVNGPTFWATYELVT